MKGAVLAGLIGVCSGCAQGGAFYPQGYQHEVYDMQVVDPNAPQMLGPEWRLDNYYRPSTGGALQPKKGPEYRTTYLLDSNGDGETDAEQEDSAYALRFTHQNSNGVIWLRLLPVSKHLEGKALSALMGDYIEDLSGAGYETVWLTNDRAVSVQKTYASKLVGQRACHLAHNEAQEAVVELANLDQLRLDPQHRFRQLRVIIARTPFSFGEHEEYPVLLIAGHANAPANFATTDEAFRALLRRLYVAKRKGSTCGVAFRRGPGADRASGGTGP